ncbi:restriction endonuclease subunit S [Bacillus altitudinis]|uniref:restriction endonuclease subunit S n=1 Tax=Bacillus altitudinis TaxID=293387 RepID=UPI002943E0DB|nr:restriction endonuclease subunit S [Bacillus altitudinis]WOI40124.1 restriction endonuclease subunit S [Bacillus altitudinis]
MSKKKKTIEELLEEALVQEEKQPYKVPKNWKWVKMGSVITLISGRDLSTKLCNSEEKGIPYIMGASNIVDNQLDVERWIETPTVIGVRGDILVSVKGTVGKVIIQELDEVHLSRQIMALRSKDTVLNKFLYLYIQTYVEKLKEVAKGIIPGISRDDILNAPFPLLPLNEQKRIADKVERLLSKIDEAKQLVEEAKKTFELRRAAILDKAFRGELTRKWRGENADITTANEWIEQINLLKEGTKTKYKDQLDSSILEKLYELPREWKWVRLNDLIEASTYGTSAKTNDDVTGTPVLRMGNIVDGYLELNNLKYLPNNHEDVLKYDLQTNDLLFNRTNSYELVGKTSVITEDVSERFTFASYLIRVRLFYKDFLASYVSHYINSHVGRKILLSMVTQQVGQANINSQKLASLPIPLPSQEEVMEITSWLNNYRELESKQKEMILVEENIEALKQSILSKAFRGELGTNDLGEESAIELLKDVLQEQVK